MIYKIIYSNNYLIGGELNFSIDFIVSEINKSTDKEIYNISFKLIDPNNKTGHWIYSDGTQNIAYSLFSKEKILIKWNLKLDNVGLDYSKDKNEVAQLDNYKKLFYKKLERVGRLFLNEKYNYLISSDIKSQLVDIIPDE